MILTILILFASHFFFGMIGAAILMRYASDVILNLKENIRLMQIDLDKDNETIENLQEIAFEKEKLLNSLERENEWLRKRGIVHD